MRPLRALSTPLPLALAALLATAAGAALAGEPPAPSLPAGWIAPSPAPEDVPSAPDREFGSHQANHEFTFQVRPSLPGRTVDPADLPVVEMTPSTLPEAPPRELPPGDAADVVVLRTGRGAARRVSVQAFEAGFIQVGDAIPAAVGRQSEGGVSRACGPAATRTGVVPLSYEAVRRVDQKGSLELVWARGFLEVSTCRAAILERHTARPRHVAGGVVYAFRTFCASCAEGARDALHVLTPQLTSAFEKTVPFEHRTMRLAPGASGAFDGGSSFKSPGGGISWGMPDWHGFVDRQCKDDSTWCSKRVRLEVSWARGEAAPTLFLGGHLD